jgi:hypothetical protein
MTDTYSVWYYSNAGLGNIRECECQDVSFDEALKWFKHHTTNVTANMGWTVMVRIIDSDDYIVGEWRHGKGITWPEVKP